MFWVMILYCFICGLVKDISLIEMSIVQTPSENYYLELIILGTVVQDDCFISIPIQPFYI